MTNKKLSGTQEIGKLSAEELQGATKGVGKRVFGGSGQRGLAAFDKQPAKDAVPGGRDSVDRDLMRERLAAHEFDEDDGMVPTSSSSWADEYGAAPSAPKSGGRGKKPVVEEVEEEEVEAPPPRRSAAKWIIGGLLFAGVGVGSFFGVQALTATPAPAEVVETKPPPKVAPEPEPEPEPVVAQAEVVNDTAPEVAVAETGERERPLKSTPEAWAASVEASNPWVAVAAAPAGTMLGLNDAQMGDELAQARTGIRPGKLAAPAHTFQIQAHEVTWAEVALASTVTELTTVTTPTWLPAVAARAKLPATNVSWAAALAFCRGMGGDLPSEAEWEWVARGPEDRFFPWGRDAFGPKDVHVVAGRVPVVEVMSSPLDRTPAGVWDLLGNAQEWTRNSFRSNELATDGPKAKTHKAARGWPLYSNFSSTPPEGSTYRTAACADPSCANETRQLERTGFRCVRAD